MRVVRSKTATAGLCPFICAKLIVGSIIEVPFRKSLMISYCHDMLIVAIDLMLLSSCNV